jgi:hypothetical protein
MVIKKSINGSKAFIDFFIVSINVLIYRMFRLPPQFNRFSKLKTIYEIIQRTSRILLRN